MLEHKLCSLPAELLLFWGRGGVGRRSLRLRLNSAELKLGLSLAIICFLPGHTKQTVIFSLNKFTGKYSFSKDALLLIVPLHLVLRLSGIEGNQIGYPDFRLSSDFQVNYQTIELYILRGGDPIKPCLARGCHKRDITSQPLLGKRIATQFSEDLKV